MIPLASDENFDGDIVRGLRRRLPSIDLIRIQDTEWSGSSDEVILEWLSREARVLLTHDRRTMPHFAYAQVQTGQALAGVFLVDDHMPVGQAIEELFLAVQCLGPEDCKDQVRYFPL